MSSRFQLEELKQLLEVRWSDQSDEPGAQKSKFSRENQASVSGEYGKNEPSVKKSEAEAVGSAKGWLALLRKKGAVPDPRGRLNLHKGKTPKGGDPGGEREAFSRAKAAQGEFDTAARHLLQKSGKEASLLKHPDVIKARANLHAALRAKKSRMADPKEKASRKETKAASKPEPARKDRASKGAPWGD